MRTSENNLETYPKSPMSTVLVKIKLAGTLVPLLRAFFLFKNFINLERNADCTTRGQKKA
jgi:hypothetical protein